VGTADGAKRRELVSRSTRRAFRELCTDTVLREIDDMWQDEGFAPGPLPVNLVAERRSQFQSYLDVVDWTDHDHVARALRVFETVIHGRDSPYLANVRSLLERDGYRLEDHRRIVATGNALWRRDSLGGQGAASHPRDGQPRSARPRLGNEDDRQAAPRGSCKARCHRFSSRADRRFNHRYRGGRTSTHEMRAIRQQAWKIELFHESGVPTVQSMDEIDPQLYSQADAASDTRLHAPCAACPDGLPNSKGDYAPRSTRLYGTPHPPGARPGGCPGTSLLPRSH
jgi:hypothetical protein